MGVGELVEKDLTNLSTGNSCLIMKKKNHTKILMPETKY